MSSGSVVLQRSRMPESYLQGTAVDFEPIKSLRSFHCTGVLGEDDGRNTATLSVWSVREKNFLDWTYGFAKVVLAERRFIALVFLSSQVKIASEAMKREKTT